MDLEPHSSPRPRRAARRRVRIGIWVVAAAAALAAATLAPVAEWILAASEWIRGAGAVGLVAFAGAYVVAAVLTVPGSALTLGAGLVYGPLWATVLVSPVSVCAALIAFGLGRRALRPWVRRRLGDGRWFRAIDDAIADKGGRIVLLLRLSPLIPYSALNYACGLTRIDARRFALASWLGMLPGTWMYAYLGSLGRTTAELATDGAAHAPSAAGWLYWGGLAATLVVVAVVSREAFRALGRSIEIESRDRDAPG